MTPYHPSIDRAVTSAYIRRRMPGPEQSSSKAWRIFVRWQETIIMVLEEGAEEVERERGNGWLRWLEMYFDTMVMEGIYGT